MYERAEGGAGLNDAGEIRLVPKFVAWKVFYRTLAQHGAVAGVLASTIRPIILYWPTSVIANAFAVCAKRRAVAINP